MSLSLKDLKQKQEDTLTKLKEKSKENESSYEADDRFWLCKRDDAGNGQAVVRFLPNPFVDGEDGLPWVSYYSHGFKGPTGQWYIENSLSTFKKDDPVLEYNSKLWNSGVETNKEFVKKNSKRRLNYVSNILVIKDPANPQNEGKVFLFRYGMKIFEKLNSVMFPNEALEEKAGNPFDFWSGQNFVFIIKNQKGYPNYDDSKFTDPAPVADSDEKIEAIWKQQYSLKDEIGPDKFKTYNQLKARLEIVMGGSGEEKATKTAEAMELGATEAKAEAATTTSDDPPFDLDDKKEDSEFDFDAITKKLDLD